MSKETVKECPIGYEENQTENQEHETSENYTIFETREYLRKKTRQIHWKQCGTSKLGNFSK